jgi:hypothetical protein
VKGRFAQSLRAASSRRTAHDKHAQTGCADF